MIGMWWRRISWEAKRFLRRDFLALYESVIVETSPIKGDTREEYCDA